MFTHHPVHLACLGLLLLGGCASTADMSPGQIQVTSVPAGALVSADGVEIGTTPLTMHPANHFRSGFVGFSYRYTGKLTIKKAGCDTWTTEVNDFILSRNVHSKLKCDPNFRPAPIQPAATTINPVSPPADPSIERLERIEILHKKGLISEEEYKQARARIIEKL